jgi:hypothetical protein|tara:strand:+ start:96 stop:635 length:540 start_codon:yes stop_codon:yes gene_type:complete
MNCGTDCGGNPDKYHPWIDNAYVNNCPDNCETVCEGPTGPKNTPIFNTTYVGRARRHIPDRRITYYDCKKQRGGSCGAANNIATNKFKETCSAGRCESNCDTAFFAKSSDDQDAILLTKKNNILRKGVQQSGTSKKMEYGKYVRTTPGLETFASKKVASLQSVVANKQSCFSTYWCNAL